MRISWAQMLRDICLKIKISQNQKINCSNNNSSVTKGSPPRRSSEEETRTHLQKSRRVKARLDLATMISSKNGRRDNMHLDNVSHPFLTLTTNLQ
jgi:hypothetical protein